MTELDNPQWEAMAKAQAGGSTAKQAAIAAGYKDVNRARVLAMAARPRMVARVAEIRWRADRETADLAPVIVALMEQAKAAGDLETAAGFTAAKGLLVEAARLKGLLAVAATPPPAAITHRPEMTAAEWRETYAPKAGPKAGAAP